MTDTEKVNLISKMIADFWEYNDTEDVRNGSVAMVTAISTVVDFEGGTPMTNIYKYRGKLPGGHLTISGESWVTGDLVHIKGEPHIWEHGKFCLKVVPESVGLWLMNRNGQDIYQGDVLEYIDPEGKKQLGVIRFGEYDFAGGWHIGFYVEWADRFVATWMRRDIKFWFTCREVNVVGNVCDDKEILEVYNGGK